MFTLQPETWNDGPSFVEILGDSGAHPVARRHLCYGGGGGGGPQAPDVPDYSNVISTLSQLGYKGQGWAQELYDWAKRTGVDLSKIGEWVSGAAKGAATSEQKTSDQLMEDWQRTYSPLYKAQAADAMRMIGDLPATEERYAGKYGADVTQAMDQALATQKRNMFAQGFAPSAVATGALDTMAGLQRAAAGVAGAEQGRMAARGEARDVTEKALGAGQFIPGVSTTMAGLATGNRGQAIGAQSTAAATTAGLYNPAQGLYQTSLTPFFKTADVQMKSSDQLLDRYRTQVEAYKAAQENSGGIESTLLPLAAGIGASFLGGPAGGVIAGRLMGGASTGIPSITRTGSTQTYSARGGRIPPPPKDPNIVRKPFDPNVPELRNPYDRPMTPDEEKEFEYGSPRHPRFPYMYGPRDEEHYRMGGPVPPSRPKWKQRDPMNPDPEENNVFPQDEYIDEDINLRQPQWMPEELGGRQRPTQSMQNGGSPGAINLVPPGASPSGGMEQDDVQAMLSEGEFVIPKRTVDWLGDKFFQNLIARADKEMGTQTVAQAETGPAPSAMDTTPPMFRSEGARA